MFGRFTLILKIIEKFLTDLQSEIPQKLRITKDEVIYDFGEKVNLHGNTKTFEFLLPEENSL